MIDLETITFQEVFPNVGEVFSRGVEVNYRPQLLQVNTPPVPPPEMEDAEEEDDEDE